MLAGLTAATVAVGRPFWLETDEAKKEEQAGACSSRTCRYSAARCSPPPPATAPSARRRPRPRRPRLETKKAKVVAKKGRKGAELTAKKK
ncbi:hypothetical protein [Demequina litorisediminis]|uniref:hypothetical protein n=1 Tax=Demequina litorisediminis TaxID=1849022 RepID=UPI0024E137BC|nr:hypothetical protein [Demequina litorisediminis]